MRASLSCSVLSFDVFFLRFREAAPGWLSTAAVEDLCITALLIFSEYVNSGRDFWIGHLVSKWRRR